jgi:hypothetical protein
MVDVRLRLGEGSLTLAHDIPFSGDPFIIIGFDEVGMSHVDLPEIALFG